MGDTNIYDYLPFYQLLNNARSDVAQLGPDVFVKAQSNDAEAFCEIGNAYKLKSTFTAMGIALTWLKRAASMNHPRAKYLMGTMFHYGYGTAQNIDVAMQYYIEAAKNNVPEAVFNIGAMYTKGESVSKNYLKAFEYFQKAADLGYLDAYHALGTMYYEGLGVEVDGQKALECFTKAAKLGNEESRLQAIKLKEEGYCLPGEQAKMPHKENNIQENQTAEVIDNELIQTLLTEFVNIRESNERLETKVKELQNQVNEETKARKERELLDETQKNEMQQLKMQLMEQQKTIQTLQNQLFKLNKTNDQHNERENIDRRFDSLETKLQKLEIESRTSYHHNNEEWADPNYDSD